VTSVATKLEPVATPQAGITGAEIRAVQDVLPCCTSRPEGVRALFLSDLDRYLHYSDRRYSRRSLAIMLVTQPGVLATLLYRFGHWAHQQRGVKGRWYRLLCELAKRPVEILTGISISPTAHIGPGLYVAHFGGVFVGGDSVIGTNCNLGHDTLIAANGRGERRGSPQLGDRVNVTCGGRILGRVRVGDDVMIGVNVVVAKDVPDRTVLAAPSPTVLSQRGSFDYVRYAGDESDPDRSASARLRGDG
jgi:serine O-acetyltransferase